MPKLEFDTNMTWSLTEGGLTWTIPETIEIDTAEDYGIVDIGANNRIRILGSVLGDDGTIGVDYLQGSSVFVGKTGWISGFTTGIQTGNMGGSVTNHGSIEAYTGIFGRNGTVENDGTIIASGTLNSTAIDYTDRLDLLNEGTLSGDYGVIAGGGTIHNGKGGTIAAGLVAVDLGGATGANTVENYGIIRATVEAIRADGQTTIVNRGTIVGDIVLSDAADRIDTRGGVVKGTIFGGEGDDTYLVSSDKVTIEDTGSTFFDVVKSTARSFGLSGGLDELILLGRKNIDGSGNIHDDVLHGNMGRNRLYGGDGNDVLDGGKGNDRLSGGNGADEFRFGKGSGTDRIADFDDDLDFIASKHVRNERDFDRLDVRQTGNDVTIDFGHGDRLIIEKFNRQDLGFDDFIAPV